MKHASYWHWTRKELFKTHIFLYKWGVQYSCFYEQSLKHCIPSIFPLSNEATPHFSAYISSFLSLINLNLGYTTEWFLHDPTQNMICAPRKLTKEDILLNVTHTIFYFHTNKLMANIFKFSYCSPINSRDYFLQFQ